MTSRPGLIGVDWGSTRFRAYLLDETGELLDSVENDQGIFRSKQATYEEILRRSCEHWLRRRPGIPVVMAGMIGSRNGWHETGYLPCPVGIHGLGAAVIQIQDVDSHPVCVVPGISAVAANGLPDVIRGEETQLFGAADTFSADNLLACMPGTHSKWIRFENNRITRFSTFMTGEMFAALRRCASISSMLDDCAADSDEFMEGVGVSQRDGGLLNHLFSIRARALTGRNGSKLNESYLSGLLIGAEIKSALELYRDVSNIAVIGGEALIHDYSLAFSGLGISASSSTAENAFIKGLWKLACMSEKVLSIMEVRHV